MISFHAYWIPIVISICCIGFPLGILSGANQVPFGQFYGILLLVIGVLLSAIAWLVYYAFLR